MNYELRDYEGNSIIIDKSKADKIANIAGLIAIEVGNQIHYINPKNIASIKPSNGVQAQNNIKLGTSSSNARKATNEAINEAKNSLYNKLGKIRSKYAQI